jgi:hypothetical protein
MKFLWTLLLLVAPTFSQVVAEGGVVGAQLIPNVAYDFELCCGGPGSGFVGNGFYTDGAVDGDFRLFYMGKGCLVGCRFDGTIQDWFTRQSLSRYCTIQSALLIGTFNSFKYYPSVEAEYSQMFCVKDGNHWGSGGTLTVHLQ